jgi:hypothetical protein
MRLCPIQDHGLKSSVQGKAMPEAFLVAVHFALPAARLTLPATPATHWTQRDARKVQLGQLETSVLHPQ